MFYINYAIIIISIIIITTFICSVFKYIRRLYYIKNFKEYMSVYEYHMDKAYDLIHKDKILAYSLDAYRVPDEDYEKISQDFVKLVRKLMGPALMDELIRLYGGEDSFIFVMLEYFGRRYEDDEIRKSAMSNLTQEE